MEKTLSNKTPALTKSTNIDGQLVHLINSLEEVLILKEYFQENKVVTDQTCCFSMSIVYFPFYLSYSIGFWQGSFVWKYCDFNLSALD